MPSKALTIIQSVWAAIIAAAGFMASLNDPFGFTFIALAVVYAYAILSWHRLERWAWWFCFLLAASMDLLYVPDFISRFALLVTNDPVYWASREMKIAVAFEAVAIVIPATLVLVLLIKNRLRKHA